jgi:hypothetical protein
VSRIETLPLERLTRQQLLDRLSGLPLRLRWALGPSRRSPQTQPRTGADPALQRLAVSVNGLAHKAVDLIGGAANSENERCPRPMAGGIVHYDELTWA